MKRVRINVKKNEEKLLPFVWINGDETEFDVEVILRGEGSQVTIVGLFLGSGSKRVVFNTSVVHKGKKTKSLTILRGVFSDVSAFSNDGMIHISHGAKAADGYFASKILLFDDAKGRSVPSLEIDENDLKAGHASTVGRPDPGQLFYLMSRGLSEKEAVKLLVSGFFDPVLTYLPSSEQTNLRKRIVSSLQHTYEKQKN